MRPDRARLVFERPLLAVKQLLILETNCVPWTAESDKSRRCLEVPGSKQFIVHCWTIFTASVTSIRVSRRLAKLFKDVGLFASFP